MDTAKERPDHFDSMLDAILADEHVAISSNITAVYAKDDLDTEQEQSPDDIDGMPSWSTSIYQGLVYK